MQSEAEPVVTQGDRERALLLLDHNDPRWWAIKTQRGQRDPLVQALARHREAAVAEAVAKEREACAVAAEGWPVEAAGDQYQASGNGSFWDEGTLYDQGRADAAAAIRARTNTGEQS
jgi:hypothetical protein